jgi:hypothetical protein
MKEISKSNFFKVMPRAFWLEKILSHEGKKYQNKIVLKNKCTMSVYFDGKYAPPPPPPFRPMRMKYTSHFLEKIKSGREKDAKS